MMKPIHIQEVSKRGQYKFTVTRDNLYPVYDNGQSKCEDVVVVFTSKQELLVWLEKELS